MKYGHFSDDYREYIIEHPQLPRPWINYLTNETYCALVSNTGGGYSFYKDCKTERLTQWLGPNLKTDRPGRYIFIRDTKTGETGSATWQPLRQKLDYYQCRVGIGYQIITTRFMEMEVETTYFVPRTESLEIWKIKIKNLSDKKRDLNVFGQIEWLLGCADEINFHNIACMWNRSFYDPKINAILAQKTANYQEFKIKPNLCWSFFLTSEKIDAYDCLKDTLYGYYNTVENPRNILEGKLKNSECNGDEAVGALQTNLTLNPGEEKIIIYMLGQTQRQELIPELVNRYRKVENVNRELEEVKMHWQKKLEPITIETPDKGLDQLTNIWLKYQLWICNMWSRSPSFYHEGQGGRGYRDSNQDGEGVMSIDPEYAKKKMLKIASLIRRDGTNAPGWSDTYGPYHNKSFKDHPTWFISTVSAYVKETGDVEFLNKKVPWLKDMWREGGTVYDKNWAEGSTEDGEGTVFDHILAQLNFTFHDVSTHGLPRIGEADWNDALDMAGGNQVGESVWLAMALVRSLKLAAELADLLDQNDIVKELLERAEYMSKRINDCAWDGQWYIRGFTDEGKVFGSSKNDEGKIFLNTQSWAILSGVATEERLPIILDSIDKHLDTKHGMALFRPAYTVFDPGLGRIAMFSPGMKENAAIFCHAHTFKLAADFMCGRGDKGFESMVKIMPSKQDDHDHYKAEPYAYAEYLVGPDHPYQFGEGAYTWVTGTAGWTFLVITEYMFGIHREFEGLRIDPVIPSSWDKCKITRPFRGAEYEIEIENNEGVQRGVKEIYVDGNLIEGNLIKAFNDKSRHKVKVVMGKSKSEYVAAGFSLRQDCKQQK